MRTNKAITISQIKTRELALSKNSRSSKDSDNSYLYNLVENSIDKNASTLKNDAFKFFKGCTNFYNANNNAKLCLNILEQVSNNQQVYDILEGVFCREIIPYIDNLDALKNIVSKRKLTESSIENIYDAIKTNKICDRILNNNSKMSSRFNFDKYIKENAYKPYGNITLKICSMIDTYATPSYAKLNIALEELSYLFQKNAIKYDKSKMVQLVTEYFINANNGMPEDDIKEFKTVLKENCCITDDDLSDIKYFMEDFSVPVEGNDEDPDINNNPYAMNKLSAININTDNPCMIAFNQFKAFTNKSPKSFMCALDNGTREQMIDTIPMVFDWVRNFAILELEDAKEYCDIVFKFVKALSDSCETHLSTKILDMVSLECDKVTALESDDMDERLIYYSTVLSKILDAVRERYDTISEMSTHKSYNFVLEDVNEEVMSLQEFKKIKFTSLITYGIALDKALAKKEGKLLQKIKDKAKNIFDSAKEWLKEDYDISNAISENIIDCITDKNHFDHIISIYEITEDPEFVKESFENFCLEMTKTFHDPHVYAYVESIDNIIEVHITDTTFIALTEQENDEWLTVFTEAEQAYCGYLLSIAESLDNFNQVVNTNLAEDFAKVESTLSYNGILGIIEASKYLNGMLTLDRLHEIAENYAYNNPMDYIGNTAISQALDSWKLEESDLDMTIETVSLLREAIDESLLSEADKEKDNDKSDKKDGEKVEKTKINFNTLKYAMITLQQKAKKAGDKATSLTNTLNMYVEKFITSVKKLYTNDDREQIIKGSIIPSFHQLMGRLLVVGGVSTGAGIVAGSQAAKAAGIGLFGFSATAAVFAAVVTIFATIAISKKSTDKERALMLDELQIEMELCEKEIRSAEDKGQIKKQRALMYRQAKLKREYQRIRYNIGYNEYKKAPVVGNKD